jgi:hypothetical protein
MHVEQADERALILWGAPSRTTIATQLGSMQIYGQFSD